MDDNAFLLGEKWQGWVHKLYPRLYVTRTDLALSVKLAVPAISSGKEVIKVIRFEGSQKNIRGGYIKSSPILVYYVHTYIAM